MVVTRWIVACLRRVIDQYGTTQYILVLFYYRSLQPYTSSTFVTLRASMAA